MTASIPYDEEARLATLRSLRVLDTLPEGEFDDLVAVARNLLDVPTAYISLVDQDRQWFKAKEGIDFCETARDDAICAHAILLPEPLIVPDATNDPRFLDNPLVTGDFHLRFYAGAPIVVEGQSVGTLCCVDSKPRQVTQEKVKALAALSRQASALLTARLRAEQFAENERRFTAFLDHAPTVAFLKDEAGRMRYVNRRFEEMFERKAESVLGLTDHEWLPKAFADACEVDDDSVRRSRMPLQIEERVPVKDGTSKVWQTFKFAVDVECCPWVGGVAVDVTALRDAELQVREQNEVLVEREVALSMALAVAKSSSEAAESAASRFAELFAGLPIACYTYDTDANIHEWNSAAEALWGVRSDEAFLAPVCGTAICEANREVQEKVFQRVFAGETVHGEERLETMRDGSQRWILTNTFPIRGAHGRVVGAVSANIDVTERRASEDRFRAVVESLHEGLVMQDEEGRIILWNRSAEQVLGLSMDRLSGAASMDGNHTMVREDGSVLLPAEHPIRQALASGERPEPLVAGVQHADGEVRWLSIHAAPVVSDGGGKPTAAVASFLDVTDHVVQREFIARQMSRISDYSLELEMQKFELEVANRRLEALAVTDGLTGLKNHRRFQDELRREMEITQETGRPLSIVLLDVDRFKAYNDDFGHQEGDAVLRGVAKVLQEETRTTDTVARYGGEEFVVIMPDTDADGAAILAEWLRECLAERPFDRRAVTASFGVSTYTNGIVDATSLIRAADEALYASKASGRNRVTHWEELRPAGLAA